MLTLRIEPVFDFFPVHYIPPGRHVIRPAILVLQVVCVLPDIQAHHRRLPFHQRAVLIRGGVDIDLTTRLNQPSPSRTKTPSSRGIEFFLETVEAAEGSDDGL